MRETWLEFGGYGQVGVEAVYLDGAEADGVGHLLGAFAAYGRGGALAADDYGGYEGYEPVHESGVEEGSGESSAAFYEEAGYAAASELGHERGEVNPSVGSGGGEQGDAVGFEAGAVFVGGAGDGYKCVAGLPEEGGFGAYAGAAVHYDAEGLGGQGRAVVVSGGEHGVVGYDGSYAGHDGVGARPEHVDLPPGGFGGYPLGVAGSGGYLSVEAHGEFQGDEGRSGGDELGVRGGEFFGLFASESDGYGYSGLAESFESASGDLRVWVLYGGVDFGYSGGDDGVGAGRGSSVVGAGFKGDVEGRAAGEFGGLPEGYDLGVGLSGGPGSALADDASITDDDGADGWVGAGFSLGETG